MIIENAVKNNRRFTKSFHNSSRNDYRHSEKDRVRKFKEEGRCFKCSERGHRAFDCKEKPKRYFINIFKKF